MVICFKMYSMIHSKCEYIISEINFGRRVIGQVLLNHHTVNPVSTVSNTVDFIGKKVACSWNKGTVWSDLLPLTS